MNAVKVKAILETYYFRSYEQKAVFYFNKKTDFRPKKWWILF